MQEVIVRYEDGDNALTITAGDGESDFQVRISKGNSRHNLKLNCALRATVMRHIENFLNSGGVVDMERLAAGQPRPMSESARVPVPEPLGMRNSGTTQPPY